MTASEPVHQRPWVGAHLLLIKDGPDGLEVLLMRRTVKQSMDGIYALVAGRADQHESPRVSLAREAMEEAGLTVQADDLRHILTIHHAKTPFKGKDDDLIEFYFVTDKWQGTPMIQEPDRASELAFFLLESLPEPISPWLQHALNAWKNDGPSYIEL